MLDLRAKGHTRWFKIKLEALLGVLGQKLYPLLSTDLMQEDRKLF